MCSKYLLTLPVPGQWKLTGGKDRREVMAIQLLKTAGQDKRANLNLERGSIGIIEAFQVSWWMMAKV
jgi:hypothetical protein